MSPRRELTTLLTPWGERLDRQHPLPEYPRPQLVRDSYLNLNGPWDYAFRPGLDEPAAYNGTIVVPFPPESPLSGVGRVLQPDEVLHYRRSFTLPDSFRTRSDDRIILHLDAVDQWCRVDVNGATVTEHMGGSLPFVCDITDVVAPDGAPNSLRVTVRDPTDTAPASRGKQVLEPGGIWYTSHSGIWQTVWIEAVPHVHVTGLQIVPDAAAGELVVTVSSSCGATPCQITVTAEGDEVARSTGTTGVAARLPIADARLWTPEDPFLYDLEIRVGDDVVRSYAGIRSFEIGPDSDGYPRLLLNGKPYLHLGVLDQGYWSDGLVTPPSDEAMVFDIATMRDLGFTMLRKHIKVEPLRWYHHCDRLGMLVWQDMVNGGDRYSSAVVQVPAVLPWKLSDSRYAAFGRSDEKARQQWLVEAEATVEHLRNVVSIAVWVPFNEGWGQFDAEAVAQQVAQWDPSRQVDHASGWHDQGAGDITSLHVYFRRFRMPRRRRATAQRVVALTEYGGYSLRLAGHSVTDREFGYRRFATSADLAEAFSDLHESQILPAIPRGLGATVYTQLSDVEDETNGILTYDRRVLKLPTEMVRRVTASLKAAMP